MEKRDYRKEFEKLINDTFSTLESSVVNSGKPSMRFELVSAALKLAFELGGAQVLQDIYVSREKT